MAKNKNILNELAVKFSDMLEKEAKGPENPPNYRPAEDPDTSCGSCRHFDAMSSTCDLYDVKVARDYVCDSYDRANPRKTKVTAVTEENIDNPGLLTKLSALLSQAQAGGLPPMGPPPPGGGGGMDLAAMMGGGGLPPMGPPPGGGGGMDLAAMMGGGGMPPPGGGGMPPMGPPPGGGMPPPPGGEGGGGESQEEKSPEKGEEGESGEGSFEDLKKELSEIKDVLKQILEVLSPDKIETRSRDVASLEESNTNKPPKAVPEGSPIETKTASYDEESKLLEELLKLL
jgi:hypothetical protein